MTVASNATKVSLGQAVLAGIAMAVFYSLLALVLYLFRPLSMGLSLPELIGIYFASGIAGGAIVGVLLPYARSGIGWLLLGYLAGLPLFLGLSLTIIPRMGFPPDFTRRTIIESTFVLPGMTALAGLAQWYQQRGTSLSPLAARALRIVPPVLGTVASLIGWWFSGETISNLWLWVLMGLMVGMVVSSRLRSPPD